MYNRTYAARICISIVFAILLTSCQTISASIDTGKTDGIAVETIVSGKDLEKIIGDIKDITDKAKDTGTVAKADTPRLIEYVDKSSGQVAKLNGELLALEKSRKEDNRKMGITINTQSSIISSLKEQRDRYRLVLVGSIALNIILLLLIIGYIIIKLKKVLPV